MSEEEILITVKASAVRRFIGVGTMVGLGAVVLYLAFTTAMPMGWMLFLLVVGVGALVTAQLMWRATGLELVLTTDGLRASDGTVLARAEDVVSVQRGAFSLKPSNGFMVKMRERQPLGWRPGMWWRMGRMVAVGGVTAASQTKPMADMLAALVLERQQAEE